MLRLVLIISIMLSVAMRLRAQNTDSVSLDSPYKFKAKQIVAPATLMALGSLSLYTPAVSNFDKLSRSALMGARKATFDDYLQYSPVAAMWAMDALGLESRHRFKQQTTILVTSLLSVTTIAYVGKTAIGRRRPDLSAYNSFPSGHTSTAFMGAELLRLEFGERYPWVGYVGYLVASTTAFMRVYNNRHWFTDTVAGAGVGILSAKIGYWLAPTLNNLLWGSTTGYDSGLDASIAPCVMGDTVGVGVTLAF